MTWTSVRLVPEQSLVVEGQNQALTKERKFQMLGELTIREVE